MLRFLRLMATAQVKFPAQVPKMEQYRLLALKGLSMASGFLPDSPLILLVDDHQDAVEFMELRLKREGYRVAIARDGEEALGRIRFGELPALILLDMNLPKVCGTEIYLELRAQEATRSVPVLFVTAAPEGPIRELIQGDDRADLLGKAFKFERLFSVMRGLLLPSQP